MLEGLYKMDNDFNLLSLATEDTIQSNEDNIFVLPDSQFNLPLRISSFPSEKDYEVFVKNVERIVRYSQEYKLWVKYITDNLGQTKCALTNETINECSLEIHHHPITLYTVVKAVLNDFMTKKLEFSTFDVATKVIELHFQNKIGFIVLLSDLHKKYHNGFLNLPIELVHGDYKYIIQNYTIDENEYDRICSLCNIHLEDAKQLWKKDDYPGINDEILKLKSEKKQEYIA
jgi:hypothetical protein